MSCSEVRTFLHGYLDRELDLVRQVEIEDHLGTCGACSKSHQAQLALRSALKSEELRFRAPAHLEWQVRKAVRRAERKPWLRRLPTRDWIGAVAAVAAVLVLAAFFAPMLSRPSPTERIAQDVVSGHIRSLMPGHLTDVPSSEQHTVKPWFAGKLDFSPPVADLDGEGFTLVGGRLDYAAGRPVAVLVYRRGAHVINLFVWPATSTRDAEEAADARQGYNLVYWTRGQTSFWAISDLNPTELRHFAREQASTVRASVAAWARDRRGRRAASPARRTSPCIIRSPNRWPQECCDPKPAWCSPGTGVKALAP